MSASVFEELEFLHKLDVLPLRTQAWVVLRAVLRVLPLAWSEKDPLLTDDAGRYAGNIMACLLASWVYAVEGHEEALGKAEAAMAANDSTPGQNRLARPEYSLQVLVCIEDIVSSFARSHRAESGLRLSSSLHLSGPDSLVAVIEKMQTAAAAAEKTLGISGLVRALAWQLEADYELGHAADRMPRALLWRFERPGGLSELQVRQDKFLRLIDSGRPQALFDQLYEGKHRAKEILEWLAAWNPLPESASRLQQDSDNPPDEDGMASSALTATTSECVAEVDHLNRSKLIDSLCRLLTDREDVKAFAIGLFGHWGSGKSSLVHLLEKKLLQEATERKDSSGPVVKIALFNAWKNEKSDKLAAMLAQSVVDRLVQDLGPWQRLVTALRLAARRQQGIEIAAGQVRRIGAWLAQWGPLAVPLLVPFLVLGMALLWLPKNDIRSWLTGGLASVGVLLMAGRRLVQEQLTGWFKGLGVEKPWSLLKLPDYGEHRGLVVDIHRTLQHLCSMSLTGGTDPKRGEYLLLVVDDLDRCTVPTVKEVFDAIRLVAEIPRVVTLVAIDERMAFAAVEQHYQQFGYPGREPALVARDYLAKVLQVSVILPEVEDHELGHFIDATLFKTVAQEPVPAESVPSGKDPVPPDNVGVGGAISPVELLSGEVVSPDNPLGDAVLGSVGPGQGGGAPRPEQSAPMAAALPGERELFKDLARKFDFSNPRLVWRLYMAWKLHKSLTLEDGYRMEEADTRMRLLFWCEWLLQQEAAKRPALEKWLATDGPDKKIDGVNDEITEAMNPIRQRAVGGMKSPAFALTKAVLLPTSPGIGSKQGSAAA